MTLFSRDARLLLVALLAAGFLFFHFVTLPSHRDALAAKEGAWQAERKTIRTLANTKAAQEDLADFQRRLPEEAVLPKIIAFIAETSEAHQLAIPSVSYHPEKTDVPWLSSVSISFTVQGDYGHIRNFISAIEHADVFFIIEDFTLTAPRGEVTEAIQLQIRISAYMRKTPLQEPGAERLV